MDVGLCDWRNRTLTDSEARRGLSDDGRGRVWHPNEAYERGKRHNDGISARQEPLHGGD